MRRHVALLSMLALATASSSSGLGAGSVAVVDRPWTCSSPVDLSSVTVTMTKRSRSRIADAVRLVAGCTGRIGRVDIVQERADGIKIGRGAHDVEIGGGIVRCTARSSGAHQDGVQATGGLRVTLRNLNVQCLTANDAAFFVNAGIGNPSRPTDIVCDHCTLRGGPITARIYTSLRSGLHDSTIARGKVGAFRITSGAISPVNSGNVIVP